MDSDIEEGLFDIIPPGTETPYPPLYNVVPFQRCPTNQRFILNWPGYVTWDLTEDPKGSGPKSSIKPDPQTASRSVFRVPKKPGSSKNLKKSGSRRLKIVVEHSFGRSNLGANNPLLRSINNEKLEELFQGSLPEFINKEVRFDAVWQQSFWCVFNIWLKDSKRIISSQDVYIDACRSNVNVSESWCAGKITQIPYHDLAIASVGRDQEAVCIPITSMITNEGVGAQWATMNMFVKVGDLVTMRIRKNGSGTYIAVQCWGNDLTSKDDPDFETYFSRWRMNSKFGVGHLVRKNKNSRVPDSILLERSHLPFIREVIYEKDKVATDTALMSWCNRPMSCIYTPEIVYFAFMGSCPLWEMTNQCIVVPEDTFTIGTQYDAVVESCPLPDRLFCRIGDLPVVLHIDSKSNRRDFKRGTVVSLCIWWKTFLEKGCITHATLVKVRASPRTLMNLVGRVTKFGTPDTYGLIRTEDDSLDVIFDWRVVKAREPELSDFSNHFERVKELVDVGSSVRFNAIQRDFVKLPYCVEVYAYDIPEH